jgi:DNA-binding NarL/FixJ family response regulator
MPVSIFLVDDHQIVRQGLRMLLERHADYQVVGEAGDGQSAIPAIAALRPVLVILDLSLPDLSGIDVLHAIRRDMPETRVIVLSIHADKEYVLSALRAGASGYLLKESAYEELREAIALTLTGQSYLSQKITDIVIKNYINQPTASDRPREPQLTDREREIWRLIAQGFSNQEIADQLCLSVRTVEFHRKRLMDKLDARSVADLVRLAIRDRVITLEA